MAENEDVLALPSRSRQLVVVASGSEFTNESSSFDCDARTLRNTLYLFEGLVWSPPLG